MSAERRAHREQHDAKSAGRRVRRDERDRKNVAQIGFHKEPDAKSVVSRALYEKRGVNDGRECGGKTTARRGRHKEPDAKKHGAKSAVRRGAPSVRRQERGVTGDGNGNLLAAI